MTKKQKQEILDLEKDGDLLLIRSERVKRELDNLKTAIQEKQREDTSISIRLYAARAATYKKKLEYGYYTV